MKKILLILPVLVLIALVVFLAIKFQNSRQTAQPAFSPQTQVTSGTNISDEALKNALNTYAMAKQKGIDLTNGPCLGIVAPDWVLDIAHNPRQSVDDKEENQCPEFKSGQARHFIELDPDGKLIRTK